MDRWTAGALEFSQIKTLIQDHATSSLGKELVRYITPTHNHGEVELRLQETAEALDYLRLKGAFPLGGFRDVRHSLERAQIGGRLNPDELLDIVSTLYAGRKANSAMRQVERETAEWPILRNLTESIMSFKEIEESILYCIDEQGMVKDQSSAALKSIRQQIDQYRRRIQQVLQQMLRSRSMQKMLQEPIVTQRFERYVIPVKQEYRTTVEGIVHDQSASGATLFIEPSAVVSLNNQLREAEIQEENEIEKVLYRLSGQVSEIAEVVKGNVDILSQLDFAFAKAHFAQNKRAICPQLATDRKLRLKKARHPLLSPDQVVPIDVELGDSYQAIIITGPNTGGKTVSLKTVGLFALMTQCGFPITAEEDSQMPIYSGVYADIGDEQSIEQSLSTFSAHMKNIIRILDRIDEKSLVLFDELGAGTDPTEGAALAMAVLEHVFSVGSSIIATTHYSELKLFAHTHSQAINASVEFDMRTLSPTYRLLIGVPGQSNAFHISERLGLSTSVIAKAKQHISIEDQQLDEMIRSFVDEKRQLEQSSQFAEQYRLESEKLYTELKEKMSEWQVEKNHLREKAREEAKQLISHAEREAEEVLKQLRLWMQEGAHSLKEHQLIETKSRLHSAVPMPQSTEVDEEIETSPIRFFPGDEVWVRHVGQKGMIVEETGDGQYLVSVGMMKMKVKQEQLKQEKRSQKKSTTPINKIGSTMVKRSTEIVHAELDIRGMMVEEAVPEIDKYLDNAVLSGYRRVSIIHGKGTGALRHGVQLFLKQHHQVKGYRLGAQGEGGSGVTVVEFT